MGGSVAPFNLDLPWSPNATVLTLPVHQQQDGELLALKAPEPKSKRDTPAGETRALYCSRFIHIENFVAFW